MERDRTAIQRPDDPVKFQTGSCFRSQNARSVSSVSACSWESRVSKRNGLDIAPIREKEGTEFQEKSLLERNRQRQKQRHCVLVWCMPAFAAIKLLETQPGCSVDAAWQQACPSGHEHCFAGFHGKGGTVEEIMQIPKAHGRAEHKEPGFLLPDTPVE